MEFNAKLLRQAADMAVKEYKHFDMGFWRVKVTEAWKKGWARFNNRRAKLGCGTACCLAGNVCIAALGIKAFKVMTKESIEPVAQGLLGLTKHEADELFSPEGCYYRAVWGKQTGTLAYAKAIRAGVERFIEEKEAA